MRISKGDLKNRMGCNNKLRESERRVGTSKSGLHKISMDHTLKHQGNVNKACLLLILLVVMHH
jgi:hypothetical protein